MGVCGALGSFAFLVGFEDDSSPKSPDRSPSPATVTYMLTWVASVNSLYPGVLVRPCSCAAELTVSRLHSSCDLITIDARPSSLRRLPPSPESTSAPLLIYPNYSK